MVLPVKVTFSLAPALLDAGACLLPAIAVSQPHSAFIHTNQGTTKTAPTLPRPSEAPSRVDNDDFVLVYQIGQTAMSGKLNSGPMPEYNKTAASGV